jgi:hypothetical protein
MPPGTTPPFIFALYKALNDRRTERGLAWAEVVREINRPFQHVTSRPIAASTVTGMRTRWAIEGDGTLQMLRWLGRSPESFVPDCNGLDLAATRLPIVPDTQILRFHTRRLYAALDAQRVERGLTWVQVTRQTETETPTSLRHLAKGGRTGFPAALNWCRWLESPVAAFTRGCSR